MYHRSWTRYLRTNGVIAIPKPRRTAQSTLLWHDWRSKSYGRILVTIRITLDRSIGHFLEFLTCSSFSRTMSKDL
ncbi:hypothetical protein D6D25_09221 [Aureobasidium pullulans]|nr:hypothetical protein D6D25_09221 [Aureobasidium pullulans]